MLRGVWAPILALMLALAAGPSAAQQQPQAQQPVNPFAGQFSALEVAPTPMEAVQLQQLMHQALAAVEPQRRGRLDVYLITVALWGDPVFEREATQAEALLRRHFRAEGRSIVLTAGGQGQRAYPAATPENIAAAFGRIGSLIDAEEDLVVVFLTSHGAPDGTMSMREHARLMGALGPQHLRQLLYLSNIRNRVVIVSSCFSGAFVPALADERTIVLTAAAHDRSSFGCAPENDWTLFGDALFNRALRGGAGLLDGFDQAKAQIEVWEREQSLTPPSDPQRFVGPRAARLVAEAERGAR